MTIPQADRHLPRSGLVVNADDFGITRGSTDGIVRAHLEGIVTSASLATAYENYQYALDLYHRRCPRLGLGLHFTLTSGRPVLPPHTVPLLVDTRGYFRWRFGSLYAATHGPRRTELLAQIAEELDAQIQRLSSDGVLPDHIDGERHIHQIPAIFPIVAAAARRHGIGYVRAGRDGGVSQLTLRRLPAVVGTGGALKSALLGALTRRNLRHLGGGVRTPDTLMSYMFTGQTQDILESLLQSPPLPGITELMVHPGLPALSRGSALGNPELERYLLSRDRQRELNSCISAKRQTGAWTLTTFGALAS